MLPGFEAGSEADTIDLITNNIDSVSGLHLFLFPTPTLIDSLRTAERGLGCPKQRFSALLRIYFVFLIQYHVPVLIHQVCTYQVLWC